MVPLARRDRYLGRNLKHLLVLFNEKITMKISITIIQLFVTKFIGRRARFFPLYLFFFVFLNLILTPIKFPIIIYKKFQVEDIIRDTYKKISYWEFSNLIIDWFRNMSTVATLKQNLSTTYSILANLLIISRRGTFEQR